MYSKEFRESLNAVEAAREANIALLLSEPNLTKT